MSSRITVLDDTNTTTANNTSSSTLRGFLPSLTIPAEYAQIHDLYSGSGHGHPLSDTGILPSTGSASQQPDIDFLSSILKQSSEGGDVNDHISSTLKQTLQEQEQQRLEQEAQARLEDEEARKGVEEERKRREMISKWKKGVSGALKGLRRFLRSEGGGGNVEREDELSLDEWADVALAVIPFGVVIKGKVGVEEEGKHAEREGGERKEEGEEEREGGSEKNDGNEDAEDVIRVDEPWVDHGTQKMARDILSTHSVLSAPSLTFLQHVLSAKLKPIFKLNPHPNLHLDTARRLEKPAGGFHAKQDFYHSQPWKEWVGVGEVVFWCVKNVKGDDYEKVWHLIVPPIMTLLDDYDVNNKLRGVLVAQEMLRHVPFSLVRRTGLDKLINNSVRACLAHLDHPSSAALIRAAVSTSVTLICNTTSVKDRKTGLHASDERFNELSGLLGDGIIAGVWLYAEDKPKVVHATLDVLPRVIHALDLGTVRFMQALIPQVTHCLVPRPFVAPNRGMELSALRVLDAVIDVCRARISSWAMTILDALARCWVGIVDSGDKDESGLEVKMGVERICSRLDSVCGSRVGVGKEWDSIVERSGRRAVGN